MSHGLVFGVTGTESQPSSGISPRGRRTSDVADGAGLAPVPSSSTKESADGTEWGCCCFGCLFGGGPPFDEDMAFSFSFPSKEKTSDVPAANADSAAEPRFGPAAGFAARQETPSRRSHPLRTPPSCEGHARDARAPREGVNITRHRRRAISRPAGERSEDTSERSARHLVARVGAQVRRNTAAARYKPRRTG